MREGVQLCPAIAHKRCANVTAQWVYVRAREEDHLRRITGLIAFVDKQGEWARMSLTDQDEENLAHVSRQSFTGSALFEKTFDEGMSLVEETARYLDGRGREESKDLPRKAALLYAGESMRVTTRLMQAASWLLVQRAVHEGEMEAEQAAGDRYRLGSKEICLGGREDGTDLLPQTLQDLLKRSDDLYRRIERLDDTLFRGGVQESGAKAHINRLEKAFGAN